MKKLSLVLLGALATAQVAQAAPGSFNGFYLGGQLGWTQRNDKTDLPKTTLGALQQESLSKNKKANGLTYGIYGGYGQNNNGFYFGGEFSIEHGNASKNVKNQLKVSNASGVIPALVGNLDTKYERGVVFGITPRIGAVIAHENLVYAKLGIEFSRDKLKTNYELKLNGAAVPDGDAFSTVSKSQIVIVPGIGYERAFGNLLARVEYGYNCGAKIKAYKLASWDNNSAPTVKYTAHIVKFGLAYRF